MRPDEGRGFPARNQSGHSLSTIPCSPGPQVQSGGSCSSPISLLIQRLVTFTSNRFSPDLAAAVISTENGGFHKMPRLTPLRVTSAIFLTPPRSRTRLIALTLYSGSRLKVLLSRRCLKNNAHLQQDIQTAR